MTLNTTYDIIKIDKIVGDDNMKLTKREEYVKKYTFELFIPTLHHTIKAFNEQEYKKWGGNTCRQSAILGAYFLNQWLPEYEWQVWDGNFTDIIRGKKYEFNHAWIYGENKQTGEGLFLDLSNVIKERLFFKTKDNVYPSYHEQYKNQKELNRVQLDWEKMLATDYEYYTKLHSMELANLLQRLMLTHEKSVGLKYPR